MGTKRFLISEDEVRNILTLYKEKNLIKESISDAQNSTKKDYWDWCARPENRKIIKSKNDWHSKVADSFFETFGRAGTLSNTFGGADEVIGQAFNGIGYCGDLMAVNYIYGKKYQKTLWDELISKFENEESWLKYINAKLYDIKERTEKKIKSKPKIGGGPTPKINQKSGFNTENGTYTTKYTQKVFKLDQSTSMTTIIPEKTKIWINKTEKSIVFGNTKLYAKCDLTNQNYNNKLRIFYIDSAREGYLANDNFDSVIKKTFCNGNRLKTWDELVGKTTPNIVDGGGGGSPVQPDSPRYIVYSACTGEYKRNCKSETIRKVQGCLKSKYGLATDGKFGRHTENAIYRELGRKLFTDSDVNRLCATNQQTPQNQPQTPESGTQAQTYSGDEYNG